MGEIAKPSKGEAAERWPFRATLDRPAQPQILARKPQSGTMPLCGLPQPNEIAGTWANGVTAAECITCQSNQEAGDITRQAMISALCRAFAEPWLAPGDD